MAPLTACSLTLPLLFAYSVVFADARRGFGEGGQEYGYVKVRDGAHLFYWLYYTGGGETPAGRPLVIWLEGGPGASSTSYGNFGKLGPLDPSACPRNVTWVSTVNLMFVDSPVGTGYSYVDNVTALARTNRQTSSDLVELTRQFLILYPQFRDVPLYIFGESYGGKVAAEFALDLYQEMISRQIDVHFKGVVMGASWLSGVDHVESWAPYLFNVGMLDSQGRDQLSAAAARVRAAAESLRWQDATSLWFSTWGLMTNLTEGVNIYNFLSPIKDGEKQGGKPKVPCASPEMMNGDVRVALGVPESVNHQNDNSQVFMAQYEEFMKPATETVERLLNETTLTVTVYASQCDVFTNIAGTMEWVGRLRWPSAEQFSYSPRKSLLVNGSVVGFVQHAGNFTALRVLRSGHMVSNDYPEVAAEILKWTVNNAV